MSGNTAEALALRPRAAPILAVASGKGGVGKTWMSTMLATAFGRAGQRALLVDCDLGLANVDVQLGVVQPAIEVVIAPVGDVRLPFAESPIADLLLAHRLVEAKHDAAIAIFVFEEPDLGIEILTRAAVFKSSAMAGVVVFGIDVVRVVSTGQTGRLGARGKAVYREVLADSEARIQAKLDLSRLDD